MDLSQLPAQAPEEYLNIPNHVLYSARRGEGNGIISQIDQLLAETFNYNWSSAAVNTLVGNSSTVTSGQALTFISSTPTWVTVDSTTYTEEPNIQFTEYPLTPGECIAPEPKEEYQGFLNNLTLTKPNDETKEGNS